MEVKESKKFIQNSYILMVGYFLSTLVSTIGTILVIRLISVEEYGLINIAFIVPNILINLSELGLNFASIHFIARKMGDNDEGGVKNVIRINLYIKILIGTLLTLFVAFFPTFIAHNIYNIRDDRMIILIQIAAIGVISSILYEALISFFLGAQDMNIIQYGSILRSFLRTSISIILILIGFTLLGPAIGFVFSTLITVIFYLFFLKRVYPKRNNIKSATKWKELSKMFKYGYPLMLGSFIAAIEHDIYFLILTANGLIAEVSYLNVAITSAALIGILKKAILNSLFPVFSKRDWSIESQRKSLINYYQFSLKFEALLILPVAIFIILFSGDFFYIIFGDNYKIASPFISSYFLIYLLIPIGSITIPVFLNGQKKTNVVLLFELIIFISSIIFSILLIPFFGGLGLLYGMFLGRLVALIYGNMIIYKNYGTVLYGNLKNIFYVFFTTILSGIITYLSYNFITIFIPVDGLLNNILVLGIIFFIYLGLLLFFIGIFSLITYEEIDLMVTSFQILPIFNKIFYIIGEIEKRILKIRLNSKR